MCVHIYMFSTIFPSQSFIIRQPALLGIPSSETDDDIPPDRINASAPVSGPNFFYTVPLQY